MIPLFFHVDFAYIRETDLWISEHIILTKSCIFSPTGKLLFVFTGNKYGFAKLAT